MEISAGADPRGARGDRSVRSRSSTADAEPLAVVARRRPRVARGGDDEDELGERAAAQQAAARSARSRAPRPRSARPRRAGPTRRRLVPRAGGGEAAERGGDRLRPRLQLPEVARRDHDAALDRGEPQAGDEELPRDDRRDHPAGEDALRRPGRSASASTSTLSAIGSSSEPSGVVRALPPREPAVDLIGRHRGDEQRGRPVGVGVEVPLREENDHERASRRCARR